MYTPPLDTEKEHGFALAKGPKLDTGGAAKGGDLSSSLRNIDVNAPKMRSGGATVKSPPRSLPGKIFTGAKKVLFLPGTLHKYYYTSRGQKVPSTKLVNGTAGSRMRRTGIFVLTTAWIAGFHWPLTGSHEIFATEFQDSQSETGSDVLRVAIECHARVQS